MVNVISIRHKRVTMLAKAMEEYSHDIEHRHQQGAVSNDHLLLGRCRLRLGADIENKEAENEAHCETSGVSHKEFSSAFLVAEYIVDPEWNKHAKSNERECGINLSVVLQAHQTTDYCECYYAETRREPVDSINKVDGIGKKDDNDYA